MKKLIFLLLVSCELFGQQELFHAQNKGLLLDEYPNAAAAYSLRRVNSRYTGPLIRVRKDSTGQLTQDIGSIGEALDTVALKAFAGANSCYVSIWFDQSGNARNATQATAANQPRIVSAGIIERISGKLAMFYDGTNDCLERTDTGLPTGVMTSANVTYYSAATIPAVNYKTVFHYGGADFGRPVFVTYATDGTPGPGYGTNALGISQYGGVIAIQNRLQLFNLLFFTKPATTNFWYIYINNTLSASKSLQTNTILRNSAAGFRIGQQNDGLPGAFMLGYIQEINIWAADYTTSRIRIEQNINSYYAIY